MSEARELRERIAPALRELGDLASGLAEPVTFMEVCGTHTVSAARGGLHSMLPDGIRLVSGPGCPVCVTPQSQIDALIDLGRREDATLATYGDLVRVPGRGGSLEEARSEGADVRMVTSTMEALDLARAEPGREVVFAGIGFETTAPATAVALRTARGEGLSNFSVLSCHKLVLPALRALLGDPDIRIDGFLCPGHVSVVIGADAYAEVAEDHGRPCAVAGFDVPMILDGILHLLRQRVAGESRVENLYPQAVSATGNAHAQAILHETFEPVDTPWRALGVIPASGLGIREQYREHDAEKRFDIVYGEDVEPEGCRCGDVITGKCGPADCRLFAKSCTPVRPIGPCMVSSEGACRAWHRYRGART